MKNTALLFLLSAASLVCCDDGTGKITTARIIDGTWLAVGEKRPSDYWTQTDDSGITTGWKLVNPFGNNEMSITSIRFNDDGTFIWNVDQVEDWEHFMMLWNERPEAQRDVYDLDGPRKEITLYTRFEYVGIIKTDTARFRATLTGEDRLFLENEDVQLEFLKID